MKRFPKLIVTMLLLAMIVGIFTALPVSAADYDALRLKPKHLTVGHYTTTAMDGEIVKHSANKDYMHEIGCMIDNDNKGAYWSKPYKFKELKDEGGSIIPVVLIDVAGYNNGEPLAVAAFDMRLRSSMDARPLHVVLQATTAANSNTWITLADKKLTDADWDASPKQRIEFPETTVYQFRFLAYDIGEVDPAADEYKDYTVCKGDETRLALAEIDLLTIKEGGSTGSNGGTSAQKPTTGGQTATRPGIVIPGPGMPTQPTQPTQGATQGATQKPTTQAPTQPATQGATQGATTPTAPSVNPTAPSVNPTAPSVDPSAPTVDPSAPTVDPSAPTVDPSAPTVDPSAPTVDPSEPTVDPSAPVETTPVAPTEGEPVVDPTDAEATTPAGDNGEADGDDSEGPNATTIIIIVIAGVAVLAGALVFFIIKKKKQG